MTYLEECLLPTLTPNTQPHPRPNGAAIEPSDGITAGDCEAHVRAYSLKKKALGINNTLNKLNINSIIGIIQLSH